MLLCGANRIAWMIFTVFLSGASEQAIAATGHNSKADDGDVHFLGQVVSSACSVDVDSQNLTVQMGQVRTNDFDSVGDWLEPVGFQITLKDCDTSVSKSVGTLFTGVSDGKNPQVFKTGFGASASHGVGLGIFDKNENLLIPNTFPQFYMPLEDGNNTLTYVARYQATDRTIRAGDANTQVWFTMIYQ